VSVSDQGRPVLRHTRTTEPNVAGRQSKGRQAVVSRKIHVSWPQCAQRPVSAGEVKLISRNGHDRTGLFRAPFDKLVAAGLPPLIIDGEIAVPDKRGVTHIDLLTQAMRQCRPERSAYFASDLLHLDGHDLRGCSIEDR
jgi:hypothetical protein